MPALMTGERPPRLRIDRDRIPVPGGIGVRTETVTIVNDGGGVLRGTALSDVRWITIPSLKFNTPFVLPFRIEISPEKIPRESAARGVVTLVTNGGSAKIIVEFNPHPVPGPKLSLDDRNIQFCNLRRGEIIPFDLSLRNTGSGVLNGTVESETDWIEVKTKTIWTRDIQVIPVVIHTGAAPGVRQPVGKIRIRSTGGDHDITIPIHFRGGDGPRLRLDPPRIRCSWEKRGTIESSLIIHNEGKGLLRGTIPSPVPWLKFIPSIFPVETSAKILLKIDTRQLPGEGTLSIPVPIITNAGRDTLIVEVTAAKRISTVPPARRTRSARYQFRTRLIAYGSSGEALVLISTGRSGGEGEIFQISGVSGRCAKIFHPHRRMSEIGEKLRVMVSHPPPADLTGFLTWPLGLLTDLPGGGKVIGYIMRHLPEGEYKPAHLWYDEPGTRDQKGMDRRLTLAHTLSRIVSGVHHCGHAIGDLRENNLLINKTGDLVLIDTDSFQIHSQIENKTYWSRVGTGEYLPPEHLDGSFAEEGCDRRAGDHFALAVLIFRFLMDGVHPFQAKGPLVRDAPATTDKILLGHFAFESRLAGISPPDYAPSYDSVPATVRTLFRETFVAGHHRPSVRPDASRWEVALRSSITGCRLNSEKCISREENIRLSEKGSTAKNSLTDQSGSEIVLGEQVFRTTAGSIFRISQSNMQVFLFGPGFRMRDTKNLPPPPASLPSSLVIPSGLVLRDRETPAGWIIPAIDPTRYLPWHMIADPVSRKETGRATFSFRHRVACCRNLSAALISARMVNISPDYLSERTVFVSPDSSVKILCIPGSSVDTHGPSPSARYTSLSILIFRMLMDGYHPFHATGTRVKGFRSPERRMYAGLYPWESPDPDLLPPLGAPGIETLPRQIRNLFRNEFDHAICSEAHEEGEHLPAGPGIWFEVLDQAFSSLIGCIHNKDHWYLPGENSCPWCRQEAGNAQSLRKGVILFLPRPGPAVPCLAPPAIAGYLMLPGRFRRVRQVPSATTRWIVIPLMAERVCCQFLPRPRFIPVLPAMKREEILLVPWKRQWMACITEKTVEMHEATSPFTKEEGGISGLTDEEFIFMNEISLIDEMIWTSTADQLRGKGIGLQKKPKERRKRKNCQTKNLPDIMLMPIDLPWPEASWPAEQTADPVARREKKMARKKGAGKGIRGKLQSMLRDFFEPVPDDN